MRTMKPDKFYCFSPPIMLATFFIEIGLALYTLWRYRKGMVAKISVAILVCLALFQVAEYNVCEGAFGLGSVTWAQIGYVAITVLPPLGIHLIATLSKDKRLWPVLASYGAGLMFVGIFLFVTNGITTSACLGNYVIFEQAPGSGLWYGVYYYGLLVAALLYGTMRVRHVAAKSTKRAIWALLAGYLMFMVPTTLVNVVDPSTIAGIPSIMCGFAVLLAATLSFGVLPFAHKSVK